MITSRKKEKNWEIERLAVLATMQIEGICALKQEFPLLRRRGIHMYAPLPQQLPFEYSENKENCKNEFHK